MNVCARTLLLVLIGLGSSAFSAMADARDELVLGVPLEPPNLDPTSGAAAAVDSIVYGNVFEGLTRIEETGDVAPALAESWELLPGDLAYVFHLRRGIRFHDGSGFDAADVKFSLDRDQ